MKSTAFHFQRNDILYGRLRPYLNKVLLAGFEGLCSSEFIVLPPADTFEPEYIAFYLSNDGFVTFANSLNQGDRPRVSFDQMGDHEVPLPPFAEQQRIVAKLEVLLGKVDACRKRLEKIPVILKRFRQSVLAAACSGRLTTDWREDRVISECDRDFFERVREQRLRLCKTLTETQRIEHAFSLASAQMNLESDNWLPMKAELVCDFITKGTTPKEIESGNHGGIPFLKVYNIAATR